MIRISTGFYAHFFIDSSTRCSIHITMKHQTPDQERLNHLSYIIINSAISVHREMGPGLLESIYQHCMHRELMNRGLHVGTMIPVPLWYKGEALNKEYVIDMLVENEIILELKSVEGLLAIHEAQVISYLRLSNKRLGFLINFNGPLLKNGLKRFVNRF